MRFLEARGIAYISEAVNNTHNLTAHPTSSQTAQDWHGKPRKSSRSSFPHTLAASWNSVQRRSVILGRYDTDAIFCGDSGVSLRIEIGRAVGEFHRVQEQQVRNDRPECIRRRKFSSRSDFPQVFTEAPKQLFAVSPELLSESKSGVPLARFLRAKVLPPSLSSSHHRTSQVPFLESHRSRKWCVLYNFSSRVERSFQQDEIRSRWREKSEGISRF